MISELQRDRQYFDLFLLTPNADSKHGSAKLFVPNSSRTSLESDKELFRFLGFLMGNGVLNNCPVPLDMPRFLMRKIVSSFAFIKTIQL